MNRSYDPTFEVLVVELLGYELATDSLKRIAVDANGQIITIGDDPLFPFKISDLDDDETTTGYNYYGYVKNSGAWYIMREDLDNKAYRYATGSTDYATNWGNRIATVTYDYLFNVTIY
jgi:hypothetical protein